MVADTNPRYEAWREYLIYATAEIFKLPPSMLGSGPTLRYGSVIRGNVSRTTMMVVSEEAEQAGWTVVVIAPGDYPDYRHRVGQRFRVVDIDKYEVLEA